MIDYQAFMDEMLKIASAAAPAAAVAKAAPAKMNLLAEAAMKHPKGTAAALIASGAVGYHGARRAVNDYLLGRQIRRQQQGQY